MKSWILRDITRYFFSTSNFSIYKNSPSFVFRCSNVSRRKRKGEDFFEDFSEDGRGMKI